MHVAGVEWERSRAVPDEFGEEGSGQIMDGIRGHGKEFIFYGKVLWILGRGVITPINCFNTVDNISRIKDYNWSDTVL